MHISEVTVTFFCTNLNFLYSHLEMVFTLRLNDNLASNPVPRSLIIASLFNGMLLIEQIKQILLIFRENVTANSFLCSKSSYFGNTIGKEDFVEHDNLQQWKLGKIILGKH